MASVWNSEDDDDWINFPKRKRPGKTSEQRIQCLVSYWQSEKFWFELSLIIWSWYRIYDPAPLPQDPSTFTSDIDECISIASSPMKEPLILHFGEGFSLQGVNCNHANCAGGRPSRVSPNQIIAIASGHVHSLDIWLKLLNRELTVSHLCHNAWCRNWRHIVLESLSDNRSRQQCNRKWACQCEEDMVPCLTEMTKTPKQCVEILETTFDANQDRYFACPYPSCTTFRFPREFNNAGLPDHLSAIKFNRYVLKHIQDNHNGE